jgi:hypothetical protein
MIRWNYYLSGIPKKDVSEQIHQAVTTPFSAMQEDRDSNDNNVD